MINYSIDASSLYHSVFPISQASCTLEAGVKIYAYRVDSVHSETYKVLGGLNRTAAYGEDHEGNNIFVSAY